MLVATRHPGPVDLDGDVPEPIGQIAGSTPGRPPAEPSTALAARQPIVGPVDHPPQVPIRLVNDHLGNGDLVIGPRRTELPHEEGPPPVLNDGIDNPGTPPATRRPSRLQPRTFQTYPHPSNVQVKPTGFTRLTTAGPAKTSCALQATLGILLQNDQTIAPWRTSALEGR
jgi:hypothetical protein